MQALETQDSALRMDDRPYRILGWSVLAITFVALLGWSVTAPLDSAVLAGGRVTVASLNKRVQHLDGGLVKTIEVRDGDLVEQGQLLLSLDARPLQIKLDNVVDQLIETEANLERLATERDAREPLHFTDPLRARAHEADLRSVLDTQQQLFDSRRQALRSEQAILHQRLKTARREIQGTREAIGTLRHRLELLNQDLAGLRKLADQNLASKTRLREVQRNRGELRGDIIDRESDLARFQASIAETRSRIELLEKDYRKEVVTRLRDHQVRRHDLLADQQALEERLGRIQIRSPVAGKVKGLEVVTRGAVIEAGSTLMEIVPRERNFSIHARVSPMDIDSLHPGLKAEIRIPAFDGYRSFDSLYSDLEDVSTDVFLVERTGEAYYKATLRVDTDSLTVLEKEQLQLVSGMPVEVVIKTGERTLFDYLVKPLRDMLVRAFNET